MSDPDPLKVEYLKRRISQSIRDAQSEGVLLEEFLATQYKTAPNHVSDGALAVMLGWAVILWFETEVLAERARGKSS